MLFRFSLALLAAATARALELLPAAAGLTEAQQRVVASLHYKTPRDRRADPAAAAAVTNATYVINASSPRQTIWGIGFEIQSDSIGSDNNGLPESNSSVPWELTPSERQRFATDMLAGFRFCRLALGLYFRGTSADNRSIQERWPGQAAALAEMATLSGIEGFAAEYWSPPPGWKSSRSFVGGTLVAFDDATLDAFGDAVVGDLRYLQANGITPVAWGLQNEPPYSTPYSCCVYTRETYTLAFAHAAPKVRDAFPDITIHVCSNTGQASAAGGDSGAGVAANASLAALVDGWTWHCVGCNSDAQLGSNAMAHFLNGSLGKPVWNNEFEYLDDHTSAERTINTAQSIMNWFAFGDSPTWYWLHALKPTTNAESAGYGLGYWRPLADANISRFPDLRPGHWTYNPDNWNGVAGFARYLPWDSVRLDVQEAAGALPDARILAYLYSPAAALWRVVRGGGVAGRAPHYAGPAAGRDAAARAAATLLAFVLSNRGASAFAFDVVLEGVQEEAGPAPVFAGHGYGPNATDVGLGSVTAVLDAYGHWALRLQVPPLAVQFWVQE